MLAIVLIPSAALLITGASVAGYLISEGISARNFSSYFVQASGPLVQFTSALEQERTISLRALGGDRQAQAGLQAQWNTTDAALNRLIPAANVAQGLNPHAVTRSNALLHELADEMPVVRQGVQTGRASVSDVDAFYTRLAVGDSSVLLQSALSAPDTTTAIDEITVLDLNSVPDLHSRVVGLGAGWAVRGIVTQPDRLILAQLTGAYRNQLQALASRLPQSGQAAYDRLVAGNAWRLATSGEDDLAQRGKLAMPLGSWLSAENTVSADLFGLWGDDLRHAQAAAVDAANRSLSRSILAGSLVLVLAVAAFVAAIVLANGLVRRLRRLRTNTLELADSKLPSIVRRIGGGDSVDVESEVAMLDYGSDEIGQVAEAFNTAQRTAVAAAAAEARTRAGISKVFLDIAHRSQLVVHRQLELLDVAEAKQNDPEHLELLFQLDHLATRARRNAENLLILGGGQPGRRWRRPAALEDIVRSAVSETEHFARVSTVRLPDVQVQGAVVGDLIHLLAELVDNATAFSPPDAAVTVRGNLVGKGVVVELEDQGLGIEFGERERLNETLANPPDFQAMALSGQRQLGLFVVGQLAQRHGIAVSLLESAYGGIKAIVLIPSGVIEADATAGGDSSAMRRPGRHEQPQQVLAGVAPGPVPRPRGRQDADLRGQPTAERPAEPVSLPPSWPDVQVAAASLTPWDTAPGPASGPAGRNRVALPRRERMANLAPGLRLDAEAADSTGPRRTRSPEEARGSMSAFQRGTRLGRDSSGQDNR
ncbi:sensor histidine kinase [Trebonia kvetii]|uniref:sensor histidine kinase n=1 Tax=Trebonia kvetii TaxID=2480626 RepID=UPI0016526AFE|nr:nitrate- and nitrite sensing domain-containing protein [Trebonia kvetii]